MQTKGEVMDFGGPVSESAKGAQVEKSSGCQGPDGNG